MSLSGILLAIDSSTSLGSVAVGDARGVLAEVSIGAAAIGSREPRPARGGHSSSLLPAVEYALSEAGLRPADLAGVVVGAGPGSFTGLRIAGATAKGIVHALRLPLFAYSSLLASAAAFAPAAGAVCAMFDARGRDVFAAAYRFHPDLETIFPPAAMSLDEGITRCREARVALVTGDATFRHADELTGALGVPVAPPQLAHPRAAALLWLATRFPADGAVARPSAWEPDYLRPSGAERIAAARANRGAAETAPVLDRETRDGGTGYRGDGTR